MKKTNKTRKIAAMIAAMALTAAMCVPTAMMSASAVDETTGSITIANNAENHTYKAYQIFKGNYDLTSGALSDVDWGDGITGALADIKAITLGTGIITTQGAAATTVPFANVATAADIATILEGAYADGTATAKTPFAADAEITRKLAAVLAKHTVAAKGQTIAWNSTNSDYEATAMKVGYYLVVDETNTAVSGTDDAYSRYIVQVLGTPTNVSKKTDTPQVMKKVEEESITENATVSFGLTSAGATNTSYQVGAGFNDIADYDAGDDVTFKLYGSMPSTIDDYVKYKYVFHDSLDSNFTFKSATVSVQIGTVTVDPDCYTVNTSSSGDTFAIEFADIKSVKADDSTANETGGAAISVDKSTVVTVTYDATLNKSGSDLAVVGLNGQRNEVYLEFSNNPNWDGTGDSDTGKTEKDGVIVFTYGIDINKVKEDGTTKLADAKFAVYYLDTDGTTKKYIKTNASNYYDGDLATPPTAATEAGNANGVWVSATSGNIIIKGLDADKDYYITELAAPAGYNKLADDIKIEITPTYAADRQAWTYGTTNTEAQAALTALSITSQAGSASAASLTGVSMTANANGTNGTLDIKNLSGSTLPSTGGIGTTLFVVGGGVTMAAAGIYLVSKKRAKEEDAQ